MQVTFSPEDLRPIVRAVVAELSNKLGESDRLAYTEPEAAALLGVKAHVLRDLRLAGKIRAARVGLRHVYRREDLARFLSQQVEEGVK